MYSGREGARSPADSGRSRIDGRGEGRNVKGAVRRKPGGRPDPLERDIEMALRPCVFIPDRVCFSFVGNLEDVAGGIAGLIAGGPTRAVTLYETFLAACYEKASEGDDSSGNFGGCGRGSMQPRRRRPPPTGKRKATRNMPAVAGAIRCGRSTSRRGTSTHTSRSRRRRGSRRKPEEALSWIERGIDIAGKAPHASAGDYDLVRLKRSLLDRLGRGSEALEDAWAEYRKHPNKYAYDELMQFVPKAEGATWHRKALEVAEDADLYSLIGLLLETGEMDRLADLVRRSADGVLEQVSHYAAEPAATKLGKRYPDAAVRLWGR